jgi:signal transduction histidine kinase
VSRRGQRLDETKPGSGLGLSIVVELARLYGGALNLGTAPIGGLRAELVLPAGRGAISPMTPWRARSEFCLNRCLYP